MGKIFLSLQQVSVSLGAKKVLHNINLDLGEAERWAIVGHSGSGKTTLAQVLAGRHFFTGRITTTFGDGEHFQKLIRVVEQQHRFKSLDNRSDFYYQQRYNSFDDEQTLTVAEELARRWGMNELSGNRATNEWMHLLHVDQLLSEPLIHLSNGENKRLQIFEAMLDQQELLILDEAFTGLDVEGRELLNRILWGFSNRGIRFLWIGSFTEIPDCITHVAILDSGNLIATMLKSEFDPAPFHASPALNRQSDFFNRMAIPAEEPFQIAVRMNNVSIRYGDRIILDRINWKVNKGDKWSLTGPNGAGKSTLLSLINGDHPQAYANEIYLFGKRRGTGESIWDIKQKIGYISPELHLFFDTAATCFQAVASGIFDTIGLFRRLNADQEETVKKWLTILGLEDKQDRLFTSLAIGEQRLSLLARALIKSPSMLILDEPCQGLDEIQSGYFKDLINQYCEKFNITLIYVSHYVQQIPSCVRNHVRLEAGKIVECQSSSF
ncbi:MAG: ATP-binding cassette domain-containing protein [Chitinophagales bacterium]